jgi:hypothetical protein
MYVDPESWDGSDVFVAANRLHIYAAEAAAQALQRQRLNNVVLEREEALEARS